MRQDVKFFFELNSGGEQSEKLHQKYAIPGAKSGTCRIKGGSFYPYYSCNLYSVISKV